MECSVCLSSIKIPLILECFECFRPYEYNCMTKNRVCFFCFLTMREKKTNCLICRSKAKDYDKFRVDLEYIYNDIKENDFQCKFCEKQFQTHKDLYKHCFLEDKCIYKCECDKFIKKEEELFHKSQCEKFILCNFCKSFHSKKKCSKNSQNEYFCEENPERCLQCGEEVWNKNHWTEECAYRKIQCPSCKEIHIADNIMEHYIEHLKKSKMKQEMLKEILKKEYNEFLKNVEELPNLYYQVFKEEYIETNIF